MGVVLAAGPLKDPERSDRDEIRWAEARLLAQDYIQKADAALLNKTANQYWNSADHANGRCCFAPSFAPAGTCLYSNRVYASFIVIEFGVKSVTQNLSSREYEIRAHAAHQIASESFETHNTKAYSLALEMLRQDTLNLQPKQ